MADTNDPPEWALREARDLIYRVLEIGGGWETSEQLVALALAAAWRRGLEEAANTNEPPEEWALQEATKVLMRFALNRVRDGDLHGDASPEIAAALAAARRRGLEEATAKAQRMMPVENMQQAIADAIRALAAKEPT